MTAYRYRALNSDGKLVRGVLEGDSERQVRTQLRGKSLRPVEVNPANRQVSGKSQWRLPLLQSRISAGDLALLPPHQVTQVQLGDFVGRQVLDTITAVHEPFL